jgi:thiol-disulfide isomerase/thioredoxin
MSTITRPHRSRVHRSSHRLLVVALSVGVGLLSLAIPRTASAIPAFARKYGTSCITCHTIYPKLNPFGEAFRRNGFRFPGTDSDMVKQAPVALGVDAYKKVFPDAVWPGLLPSSVPLSVGFNGQIVLHPSTGSSGGQADNRSVVVADNLVEEGHLWAGGSFDDSITYFSELTASADGIEVERAMVSFDDLVGPTHAVNVWIGKGSGTLNSFGPHSTYLADSGIPSVAVTALFGATSSSWSLTDNFQTAEVNGVISGVVDYSAGITNGANSEPRPPTNAYAHIGGKLGGVRLDGEDNSSVPNPAEPWAETALTLDAFYYHSRSRFTTADPGGTPDVPLPDLVRDDVANVFGGTARAQWLSLELDIGTSFETHSNPTTGGKATVLSQFDELSYVIYPWLVPAARFEYTHVSPDGSTAMSDSRLSVGVAALVRPNLKAVLSAQLEAASGVPPGSWDAAGGVAAPSDPAGSVSLEIESVTLGVAYAY